MRTAEANMAMTAAWLKRMAPDEEQGACRHRHREVRGGKAVVTRVPRECGTAPDVAAVVNRHSGA